MICGWSPDGRKIAFIFANKSEDDSDASVCVYDLASRETRKTSGYKRDNFWAGGNAPPIWAPDSQHFAYQIADRNRDYSTFLNVFPTDGSAPARIGENLAGTKVFETTGSWSPDGRQVVFVGLPSKEAQPELYIANVDGTRVQQITDDRRDCGEPKWSPDGQWIVFFSAKDRYPDEVRNGWNWDLIAVRPNGRDEQTLISGRTQATEGRGTFVHPSWSPDGSFIICHGVQQDGSGRGYQGTFLIDWKSHQWQQIMGTQMGSREHSDQHDWAISPDSRKVFRHGITYVVRGADDGQETDPGDDFSIYDLLAKTVTKLLSYRRLKDAYFLHNDASSWSPDSQRILFCQSKMISWEKGEGDPDLYVLELPGTAPVEGAPSFPGPSPSAMEIEPLPPGAAPPAVTAESVESATNYALIQPANLTAQQALEALPVPDRANVIVNAERNLLIVGGPPETAKRIRDYLKPIDVPAPQVVIDVLVTEMSKTASRDLGLDWTYAKGHVGAALPTTDLGPGQIFYQGVQRLDDQFFVALSALEGKGEVTICANPRLTAVSGKTATMSIRRTKYYFYTQGYDTYGRPIIQQSDISADISGKITPRVMGDGNIQVEVEVMVGNFAFTTTSSLPDVTTRQAATNVALRDGETIVIGGLVLKQETSATSKTPVLGNLPLLGQLFRSNHRRVEENVLTILITPHLQCSTRGRMPQIGSPKQ